MYDEGVKESAYAAKVIAFLKAHGYLVFTFRSKAAPDLLAVGRNILPDVFIELKINGKKYGLTPEQKRIREGLLDRGREHLVLDATVDPAFLELHKWIISSREKATWTWNSNNTISG